MVYYVACSLDEATMKLVMGRIMEDNSIRGEVTEDGVEVCYRGDDLSKIRVVMNQLVRKDIMAIWCLLLTKVVLTEYKY